ncbi:dTDP-4-dehydrorhamnose reductase [Pseudomonadota bacterium]
MRVLILGKNGMLGRDLESAFHGDDFIALDKADADITDSASLKDVFYNVEPDIVINAAGYTDVDKAEEEEELATELNGFAVGGLARLCREFDATFVHFSTDYVFDGKNRGGYNEDDSPSPINAYGRSKLLGEELLIEEMELLNEEYPKEGNYFLIRTSWLFGEHGENFVAKMLSLSKDKDEIKVVSDQHGKPTYTKDLAQQVRWLINTLDYPSGIYHITNEPTVTWAQFAQKIFEIAKIDARLQPCSSEEFETAAVRPEFSTLKNNKLPNLRSYEEAIKDYLKSK